MRQAINRVKPPPLLEAPEGGISPWLEVKPQWVWEIRDWFDRWEYETPPNLKGYDAINYRLGKTPLKKLQNLACMHKLGLRPPNIAYKGEVDYHDLMEKARRSGEWEAYMEFTHRLHELGSDVSPEIPKATEDVKSFLEEQNRDDPWKFLVYAAQAAKSGFDVSGVKRLNEPKNKRYFVSELSHWSGIPKGYTQRAWAMHTLGFDVKGSVKDEADTMRGQLAEFAEEKKWGNFLLYASDLADLGVLTPDPTYQAAKGTPKLPALKRFAR